jgi:hypothetical protein
MTIDAVARSSELSLSRFRVVQLGQDPADHAEGATHTGQPLAVRWARQCDASSIHDNHGPSQRLAKRRSLYVRTHILMNAYTYGAPRSLEARAAS